MPTLRADALRELVAVVFRAAGAEPANAAVVAESLVATDLAGHHSHGVMRLPQYVGAIREGHLKPNAEPRRVMDEGPLGIIDGGWGFGQVAARAAAEFAAEKAHEHGVSCVALRNSNHCGRIGEYTELVAAEGLAGMAFVTGHGRSGLVAPLGGMARQLNTNPVAFTVPGTEGFPVTFDAATCAAAEGKIRIARNRGESVPEGWFIDAEGRPSTDPNDFVGPPPGALLPLGGVSAHKGYALAVLVDLLAGAVTDAGCSGRHTRNGNAMLMVAIDIARFIPLPDFQRHVRGLVEHLQSTPLAPGATEILLPGEPEHRARQEQGERGIEVDEQTWLQTIEAAESVGLTAEELEKFLV